MSNSINPNEQEQADLLLINKHSAYPYDTETITLDNIDNNINRTSAVFDNHTADR